MRNSNPQPSPRRMCPAVEIDWSRRIGVAVRGGVQSSVAIRFCDGLGKSRSGRGVLIFAAHIKREAPPSAIPGESVISVDTLLVRAAVIVNDGLPEMIAIVQRRAVNARRNGIDRFQPRCYFAFAIAACRLFPDRSRIPFAARNKAAPLLPSSLHPRMPRGHWPLPPDARIQCASTGAVPEMPDECSPSPRAVRSPDKSSYRVPRRATQWAQLVSQDSRRSIPRRFANLRRRLRDRDAGDTLVVPQTIRACFQ